MKSILTTVSCLLIAGITFSQRNAGVTTANTSNFSVSNSTHSSSNVQHSSSNFNVGNSHSSTNDYGNNNNNSNNYNSNSYSNNSYSNNNTSSLGSWPYYSNSNSNNNNSYNNNSYNNTYTGGSNNGYNSYNNSNYNTYDSKQSYTTRDENYGERTISQDQEKMVTKSNPYNTAKMMSNYRNNTAIQKFFKQNQKPSQIFIINAQQENTVKGTGGTIIKIAPNSFVDKNGEVVKGDVEFEVKEMYSKSDMILSNAHTVCNDQVLKSGGEVFLGAEKNGEPLVLANNKPISVEFPATSKEPMQLFNGQPNNNTVNWNLASTSEVTPVANANSQTGFSYNFSSPNMNWLNCDQFANRNGENGFLRPTTKVNVRLSDRHDSTNTAIFLVYTGQNTVTKFDGFSRYDGSTTMVPNKNVFDTKWYSVQQGADVTIVAISEINGQYYSSMNRTIIQKDHSEYINLEPTTLDQIKIDMENLQ